MGPLGWPHLLGIPLLLGGKQLRKWISIRTGRTWMVKHGHSILIPIKDTLFPFILMGIFGLWTSQTEVPLCSPQILSCL